MDTIRLKNNFKVIIFFIILFVILFVFFVRKHPLIIFDADDWGHIAVTHMGLPDLNALNPSKILPETLMPIVTNIGVDIFMPFTNDFILSQMLIHGLMVSIVITLYIYCFYRLIKKIFNFNDFILFGISIVFLILHFLIFRNGMSNNDYMFRAIDVNCYYNYIIPALLNCSLVMYFITDDTFNKKNSKLKISILIFLCYLAIFSNIFQSIILAAYFSVLLLIDYIGAGDKSIFKFIKNNYTKYIIVIIWIISLIFEANGARANAVGSYNSLFESIKNTIILFINTIIHCNKTFICIFLASSFVFVFEFFKEKLYKRKLVKIILIMSILIITYLILLCTVVKADFNYIVRADVLFGFIFFILLGICVVLSMIIQRFELVEYLTPLIVFILFFQINTYSITFADSNVLKISHKNCIEISNIIIDQIKEIDKSENKSGVVYVPKYDTEDNWPIAEYGVKKTAKVLYIYGIITNNVDVKIEFSDDMYKHLI